MHPDGYDMTYDDEWPKTVADYENLFTMKTFDLQEIQTWAKKVDGKYCTIGIKFIFHGETEPITYGRFDGTSCARAVFKSSD